MSKNSTKDALKEYDKLLLWTSLIFTALLIVLYIFANDIFGAGDNRGGFVRNLIIEFLPIGVTFIITYLVFRKVQKLKEQESTRDMTEGITNHLIPHIESILKATPDLGYSLVDFIKVPWNELLQGAMRLDIIVHYFDTWIRNNGNDIEAIFKRGGTVRLIIPDYTDFILVRSIKARFPEYIESQVKDKIENTMKKLELIQKRAGAGNLEVYRIRERVYYCAIRIDEKNIALSNYDHIRDKMKIEAPTFIFEVGKQQFINDWFEKEFLGLAATAVA